MIIETKRLVLREMNTEDYDALYAVLADSDIMQHYPYTFDEARVRGWIERNIERDNEVNKTLENNGWIVLRFWGKDILKNTQGCFEKIKEILEK